jgi:hypothetical protein
VNGNSAGVRLLMGVIRMDGFGKASKSDDPARGFVPMRLPDGDYGSGLFGAVSLRAGISGRKIGYRGKTACTCSEWIGWLARLDKNHPVGERVSE